MALQMASQTGLSMCPKWLHLIYIYNRTLSNKLDVACI